MVTAAKTKGLGLGLWLALSCAVACAGGEARSPLVVVAPTVAPAARPEPPKPATVRVLAAPEPTTPQPQQPNSADVARARALVKRGELLYRNGEYDQAEVLLKESVTLYPFLAQTNLLLGKIFLIRGSASRDMGLVHSARLMFEMARALDSSLREAEILLDLFQSPPLD